MKVSTDALPITIFREADASVKRGSQSGKSAVTADRAAASRDKTELVIGENRAASHTEITDFRKAEQAVDELIRRLADGTDTPTDIHQLDGRGTVFSSID